MNADLGSATIAALHQVVAPCSSCGSPPLTPVHRLRARDDVVCAQRVADVLLMVRLVLERRRAVPEFYPRDLDGRTAAA